MKTGILAAPGRDTLQGMTFDEMSKTGNYLAYCKDQYPDLFNSKFAEKFGYEPGKRPKERIGKKKTDTVVDKAMMDKLVSNTWDQLDRANLLPVLKEFPAIYAAKYFDKFKKYPTDYKAPATTNNAKLTASARNNTVANLNSGLVSDPAANRRMSGYANDLISGRAKR